jgi:DNA-binding transcriptional MerR regulator
MSIQQMQAFADLRRQGPASTAECLAFLEAHRHQVQERVRELEGYLAAIEQKIQRNREKLADEKKKAERDQVSTQSRFSMRTQRSEVLS